MARPSAWQAPQQSLRVGERVRLSSVPPALLAELDERDAAEVRAVVGKVFAVAGFNAAGEIELEFRTREGILHTIWVPRSCVKPVAPRR
jgi:hypothetical protein